MQLRRRSKKTEANLRCRKSSDIELGGKKKFEKKYGLKRKTSGHFHRWQRATKYTDRLTVYIILFAAFFFAADIAAFAFATRERSAEGEQVFIDYVTTYSPAREDTLIRIMPFNGMIRSVLMPSSMEDTELHTTGIWDYTPHEIWNLKPDFGGLIITPLEDDYDYDYDYEDDEEEIEKYDYDEEDDPNCKRPSWYKTINLNCNNVHEVNLGFGKYLASGFFRDAFSVHNNTVVLKVAALTGEFDYWSLEMMRIDAMVMSLMKSKKNIVDIYGHCGSSLLVDFIKGKDIDKLFLEEERKDLDNLPVLLSPTEKLNMALGMAEALSELHGFAGGVIVHGDLQYCQYLLDKDDRVILSDFNRAEPLLWDEGKQQYCKFNNGHASGNVRSPEEYAKQNITEKIDVYSFGNVLFTLLTGKEPYEDSLYYSQEIIEMSIIGKHPEIDVAVRNNSFAEAALASIMDKCFEFFPEKRLDIFLVVSLLRDALKLNDRLDSIKVSDVYSDVYNVSDHYYDYSSDSSDSSDSTDSPSSHSSE